MRISRIMVIPQDADISPIWEDFGIDKVVKEVLQMPKKDYIVAAVAFVVVIFCFLLLRSCIGRTTSNKAQIIQFVLDNEELLSQSFLCTTNHAIKC